jgi:hypothetical protein
MQKPYAENVTPAVSHYISFQIYNIPLISFSYKFFLTESEKQDARIAADVPCVLSSYCGNRKVTVIELAE